MGAQAQKQVGIGIWKENSWAKIARKEERRSVRNANGPRKQISFYLVCQEPTSKIQGNELESPKVKESLIMHQSNQLKYLQLRKKRSQCEDYINTGKNITLSNISLSENRKVGHRLYANFYYVTKNWKRVQKKETVVVLEWQDREYLFFLFKKFPHVVIILCFFLQ